MIKKTNSAKHSLYSQSIKWNEFGISWVIPMGLRRLLRISVIKKLFYGLE